MALAFFCIPNSSYPNQVLLVFMPTYGNLLVGRMILRLTRWTKNYSNSKSNKYSILHQLYDKDQGRNEERRIWIYNPISSSSSLLTKKTSLEQQRCRYNWIGLVHSKRGYSPSFGISSPCHALAYLIDIPFIFFLSPFPYS